MSDVSPAGKQDSLKATVHGLTFALMVLILAVLQIVNGFPLEWIGASVHDHSTSVWMRILAGVLPFAAMYVVLWIVAGASARFISASVAHGVARGDGEAHGE